MQDLYETKNSECNSFCSSPADQLNRECFCKTLNRDVLDKILKDDVINQDILATHPQLFSNTSAFISAAQFEKIRAIIHSITRVVNLQAYSQHVLSQAPAIAAYNPGTSGVFMGYDFHLNTQEPQLIEINTNAGGAFLNSALASAQTQCCREAGILLPSLKTYIDDTFIEMFLHEWQLQCRDRPLRTIAIVDENPQQQFLYPEFKMAQRLFERHGMTAFIVDVNELKFQNNALTYQDHIIDLVYNRLTDFSLSDISSTALRKAYELNAVVLTPNPRQHALYADKRNLVTLSDSTYLKAIGANEADIHILQTGIPKTQIVTEENANALWQARKYLFFKPSSGFGSRATYRGDKITKRVWEEILQGDYVAQQLITPSERGILVDEKKTALKMDIRAYVYEDEIQLLAARLYQGQTTNFRTQGGGFASVFVTD